MTDPSDTTKFVDRVINILDNSGIFGDDDICFYLCTSKLVLSSTYIDFLVRTQLLKFSSQHVATYFDEMSLDGCVTTNTDNEEIYHHHLHH